MNEEYIIMNLREMLKRYVPDSIEDWNKIERKVRRISRKLQYKEKL